MGGGSDLPIPPTSSADTTPQFDRLAALESGGDDSPTCLEVWKSLEAMAQPGTWTLSVWVDGADRLQLRRQGPSPASLSARAQAFRARHVRAFVTASADRER